MVRALSISFADFRSGFKVIVSSTVLQYVILVFIIIIILMLLSLILFIYLIGLIYLTAGLFMA